VARFPESELILNEDKSVYHLNLKPKNLSDVIISVGDPSRVFMVSQHFDEILFEMNKREFITHVGEYKGKQFTVISTGMGAGNIEIFMNELDALANIDLKKRKLKKRRQKLNIIRIGTSASIQEDIPIGTHLVSEYGIGLDNTMAFYPIVQSDAEKLTANQIRAACSLSCTPYMANASQKLFDRFSYSFITGNTVTCPGFYAPQGRSLRIPSHYPNLIEDLNYFHRDNFWLTNLDMETSVYYAMARMFGHEVISVNAIIANRIKGTFSKNPNKIVETLIRKVLDIFV